VKITPSILVAGMRGKAGAVVAAAWKGILYARTWVIPANPNTAGQQAQRNAFARCVSCFQGLVASVKTFLDILGNDAQQSGFNIFVGGNTADERTSYGHPLIPANRYCDPIAGFAAATGAGAAGTAEVSWTATGWTASFVPKIWYRLRDGAGPTYLTPWTVFAEGATDMTAGLKVVTGLTPGSTYMFAVAPMETATEFYGGGDFASAVAHA